MRVFAVPRSIARSLEKSPSMESRIIARAAPSAAGPSVGAALRAIRNEQRQQRETPGAPPVCKGRGAPLAFRGRALDQLIDDALLRHEADRLGMAVGDVEVVDAITSMPELQEDGHFSRQRLEYVLQAERDRGEFEAEVRRNILFERLRN